MNLLNITLSACFVVIAAVPLACFAAYLIYRSWSRCPDCGVLLWAGPEYPPHLPSCQWIQQLYRDNR